MKWVIGAVVVFGIALSVWWWVAVSGVERSLEAWFDARRSEGWQAEFSSIDKGGYPTRLDLVLNDPMLADPQTGVAVQVSNLRLHAPIYWPGDTTLEFPQDALRFATPVGQWSLLANEARADMQLEPGTLLELEALSLVSGSWIISGEAGDMLRADGLTLTGVQTDTTTYDIVFDAPGLRLGDASRSALRIPQDWPITFDETTLNMGVTFDRPWDLRALEERRPQPRVITLRQAQFAWGELRIQAAADLQVDETGVPTGTLSLQARNWRDILTLAEATGALPGGIARQIERGLGALARLSGNPDAIDVDVKFARGVMSLGFLPIGPAPRLILR
jgi:hypothetical protein